MKIELNKISGSEAVKTAVPFLYSKYVTEIDNLPDIPAFSMADFRKQYEPILSDLNCVQAVMEGAECGYLFYDLWENEDGSCKCYIPSCGYCAISDSILSRMFSYAAEDIMKNTNSCDFSVNLYAHDLPAQRRFSLMQFGIMSQRGIAKISGRMPEAPDVKELTKDEIAERWAEIWDRTGAVVNHLKTSPIFYPGEEFTEEVYRYYFMDPETNLFAASGDDGKIVGLIATGNEKPLFVPSDTGIRSIGEAYVLPEKRGTGLSKQLFDAAVSKSLEDGIEYLWVEHGTANPNAMGFWNKYFSVYQYEFIRTIAL